jgi:hypothetical protein
MLFRDGRMVSGQQNPERDANGKGGEADANSIAEASSSLAFSKFARASRSWYASTTAFL